MSNSPNNPVYKYTSNKTPSKASYLNNNTNNNNNNIINNNNNINSNRNNNNCTNLAFANIIVNMNPSSNSLKKQKLNSNNPSLSMTNIINNNFNNNNQKKNFYNLNFGNTPTEIFSAFLSGIINLKTKDLFGYLIKMMKLILFNNENKNETLDFGKDENLINFLYQNFFQIYTKETLTKIILMNDYTNNRIIFTSMHYILILYIYTGIEYFKENPNLCKNSKNSATNDFVEFQNILFYYYNKHKCFANKKCFLCSELEKYQNKKILNDYHANSSAKDKYLLNINNSHSNSNISGTSTNNKKLNNYFDISLKMIRTNYNNKNIKNNSNDKKLYNYLKTTIDDKMSYNLNNEYNDNKNTVKILNNNNQNVSNSNTNNNKIYNYSYKKKNSTSNISSRSNNINNININRSTYNIKEGLSCNIKNNSNSNTQRFFNPNRSNNNIFYNTHVMKIKNNLINKKIDALYNKANNSNNSCNKNGSHKNINNKQNYFNPKFNQYLNNMFNNSNMININNNKKKTKSFKDPKIRGYIQDNRLNNNNMRESNKKKISNNKNVNSTTNLLSKTNLNLINNNKGDIDNHMDLIEDEINFMQNIFSEFKSHTQKVKEQMMEITKEKKE